MLKADLHIHTSEDRHDRWIRYDAKRLIDRASELDYDVISITNHNTYTFTETLARYARQKGILLIPGIEMAIEGKEVLLYNIENKFDRISDILHRKDNLVKAPHP